MKIESLSFLIALAVGTSALPGCVTTSTKAVSAEEKAKMEAERQKAIEDRKAMCVDMRAGLPAKDSYFDLNGKVIFDTGWGNSTTQDIIQFGRQDKYFQYFVDSPNCGRFGLYQVKLIKREGSLKNISLIKYNVTLKNNKSFQTATNIPFCWIDAEKPGTCTVLTASAAYDKEKNLYFRYLFSDPSLRKPVEATLDPMRIQELEIY